ncbi:Peptidoglycan/xylan/chitin deacetylase [Candidatus Methanophagaceae archaeon]|nr:Peptidoglycan/xylan/chitin deacetylase [Methanophagales archaeon]
MDIEQDISSKLNESYKGVEVLPKFLDLLKKHDLKASFFTTADVCARFPNTIKRIVPEGHELGCHGLNHEMFWFKSYRKQYKEIKKATEIIEQVVGIRLKMFRTPNFGVSGKTVKALEQVGYEIDSSVFRILLHEFSKVFIKFTRLRARRKHLITLLTKMLLKEAIQIY